MPAATRKLCVTTLGFLMVGALGTGPGFGQWPQWGGASRDFVAVPAELEPWGESGPRLLWRRPLGPGYSGIVAQSGVLYTMTRRGEQEVVVALRADSGETIWEHAYDAPVVPGPALDTTWGSGPNGTPLWADGRLYTLGFAGRFLCLDAKSGKALWSHDLVREYGMSIPYFGLSTSPLRFSDKVIVIAGGAFAFDLESGEPVWSNREFDGSYASPVLVERDGTTLVIAPVSGEVVGIDATSGKLYWRHELRNDHGTILSGPVVAGNLVFASAYFLGSLGLELSPDGRSAGKLWESSKLQLGYSNSLGDGTTLYGFQNAILKALDVTSGEILWQHRGLEQSNLVRLGDHYLLFEKDGRLVLVSLDREGVEVLAEAQILEGRSWAAPAIDGTRIYARNLEEIVAYDLAEASREPRRERPVLTRPAVAAPPEFLDTRAELEAAYYRGDVKALAAAGQRFQGFAGDPDHPSLRALASYYAGFGAFHQAVQASEGEMLDLMRTAERLFKSALDADDNLVEAHAFLARVYPTYYRLDPPRGGVVGLLGDEHLKTALRLQPDNPLALAFQGRDLFYSPPQYGGDPEAGLKLLGQALEAFERKTIGPGDANPGWGHATVLVWYGQALERMDPGPDGRRAALELYEKALELEPSFATAKDLLEKASAEREGEAAGEAG